MLQIVKAPNPVLSQKAKRIAKVDKSVSTLIAKMIECGYHFKRPAAGAWSDSRSMGPTTFVVGLRLIGGEPGKCETTI